MLLLKGILLGLCVAVLSFVLFARFISSSTPAPGGGATAIDVRSLPHLALVFFGGVGIGIGVVTTLVLGLICALWYHAASIAK
jgi:hypothetical protein